MLSLTSPALFIFILFLSCESAFAKIEGVFLFKELRPEKQESYSLQTTGSYFVSDFDLEDEDLDKDIDDIDSRGIVYSSSLFYRYDSNKVFFGGLSYVDDALRKRVLDEDIPLEDVRAEYRGLESVELGGLLEFEEYENEGIQQTLIYRVRSGLLDSVDSNASIGGTNLSVKYVFNFDHSWGDLFGTLEANYFGKKKLKRIDGETQETKSYSAFSLWLGTRFHSKKSYIALMSGFGLTTDFAIESASYTRRSENGFLTRGALLVGYRFKHFNVEARTIIGSDVFNTSGSNLGDNIDYELETQKTSLDIIWYF